MDDAVRVRVGDGVRKLHGDVEGATWMQRAAGHFLAERTAVGEFIGEVQAAVRLADIEKRRDVRVGQGRDGLRVLEQPRTARRILHERGRDQFDGDRAANPRVARAVHFAEIPVGDVLEQVVMRD